MLNRPGNDSVAATVDGGRMYAAAADLSIVPTETVFSAPGSRPLR
ncbi:MAG TPA: hypothetical protein PKK40_00635 [Marmoricola sp.]|nr:hypothetical protein [Marmoricola sp.]